METEKESGVSDREVMKQALEWITWWTSDNPEADNLPFTIWMLRDKLRYALAQPDEIESLRQWKREAIEVLDEWDETWIAADKPGPLGKSKAQGVKELVESLRQRVAELEDRASSFEGSFNACEKEFAALKQVLASLLRS